MHMPVLEETKLNNSFQANKIAELNNKTPVKLDTIKKDSLPSSPAVKMSVAVVASAQSTTM